MCNNQLKTERKENSTPRAIWSNIGLATISLVIYGFGVYLTILADIGVGPWDVFNTGLAKAFHTLYGNASVGVSLTVVVIDILMHEPIGISMFIDAVVVGKTVDLLNYLGLLKTPKTLAGSIVMMLIGLVIMGYMEYFYMKAALGCGPRDSFIVGLTKRSRKLSYGVITMIVQGSVLITGYLLGGKVGIGTLICVLCSGPSIQMAFNSMHFDATGVRHQDILTSFRILTKK